MRKKPKLSLVEREKIYGWLQLGKSYFEGYDGKVLYSDKNSWELMIKDMKDLGFLKNDVELNKVLDLSFVEKYYTNKKEN